MNEEVLENIKIRSKLVLYLLIEYPNLITQLIWVKAEVVSNGQMRGEGWQIKKKGAKLPSQKEKKN